MPLNPGTRLGPYEIIAAAGAGGMGEVYRARDTRLGRDVAIKVLPGHLSSDLDSRSRFEREARAISSLNHPHICVLHDVGNEGGVDFLVMEFMEGETLASRLGRGPLPLAEIYRIGAQLCDALERAHRAGIIHRDLKPGNIMLTKSGVKLMDFGLARAGATGSSNVQALTQSPTVVQPVTAEGTIVGTFQYMAPEQLEGKEADARVDLWALGCVLYEMATGRRAFEASTQASLISTILRDEPRPMAELAPLSPPAFERLVRTLLVKDPEERVQTAHDVRLQLQWIPTLTEEAAAGAPKINRPGHGYLWPLAAVASAVALALIALVMLRPRVASSSYEFTMDPPDGWTFGFPSSPAVSPDGRSIACVVADSGGVDYVAIRTLDQGQTRVLMTTKNSYLVFWSPDSRQIGYFAGTKLFRLALDGSDPVQLADAPDARGGTWSKSGQIAFVPSAGGPVFRVPATGGTPVAITRLDGARGQVGHRYPQLLSDDRHFLYIALDHNGKKWICAGDLNGGPPKFLRETENAGIPAGPGWILTSEKRRVVARRFDEKRLTISDASVEIAPSAGIVKIGHSNLGVSPGGVLVSQLEMKRRAWVCWHDLAGRQAGERSRTLEDPREFKLSPDQTRVAYVTTSDNALWILDLAERVPRRLTFFSGGQYGSLSNPTWSADSKRIAYSLRAGTVHDVLHVISADTAVDTALFTAPGLFARSYGWSPDGRFLAVGCTDSLGGELWTIPVDHPEKAAPYAHTDFDEIAGTVSPDGRWVAVSTVIDNKLSAVILSWPRPGARYQLTFDFDLDNAEVHWFKDSQGLVVTDTRGRIFEVPLTLAPVFHQGEPRLLFTTNHEQTLKDFSSDMQRLFLIEREPVSNPAPLRVLTNWRGRLGK